MDFPRKALLAATLLSTATIAAPAAAETVDTCTGFITTLPATLTSQGVWCLGRDLTTAVSTGVAITVANSSITIDCNGFKIGNLAAGTTTSAIGIRAQDRFNVTVRNCTVRGFAMGVQLSGHVSPTTTSGGHLVEDNLLEGSTTYGVVVKGINSTIRRNRLLDIGLTPANSIAAIAAIGSVDVLDNVVEGVTASPATGQTVWGIYSQPEGGAVIARNQVRGVVPSSGYGYGIFHAGTAGLQSSIHDNMIVSAATNSTFLRCSPGYTAMGRDNVYMGWAFGSSQCYVDGDIRRP